jgi:hypothetical protein
MKFADFGRYALCSYVAAAMLAGCGGSQPPVGALGAMPQSPGIATHAERGGSWVLPEAKGEDLLYVSNGSSEVDVYSYPKGSMVGLLSGFVGVDFMCVDGAGDIFIPTSGLYEILKFAHGGTEPIATLSDPYGVAVACSVDHATGNLAVVNAYAAGSPGSVAVFPRAKGTPKLYRDPNVSLYKFCAYDGLGDLFLDGVGGPSHDENVYAELRVGQKRFRALTLESPVEVQNGLQWEGTYLAVGSADYTESDTNTYIYHVKVTGKTGTTIGTTTLIESGATANFFIQGSGAIVAGGVPDSDFKFFPYPGGGPPSKTFSQDNSVGVVVSNAP